MCRGATTFVCRPLYPLKSSYAQLNCLSHIGDLPRPRFTLYIQISTRMAQNRVPSWVASRLSRLTAEPNGKTLRWECYLYGPLNVLCNKVFPPERCFMVVPQLVLINEFEGQDSSMTVEDGVSHGKWTLSI